jgi:hypothetical protein
MSTGGGYRSLNATRSARRWARDGIAHDQLGVSSVSELGALAAGLVRGAEAVGYLTRDGEGTIAPVDCLMLTPDGVSAAPLPAGPDPVGHRR